MIFIWSAGDNISQKLGGYHNGDDELMREIYAEAYGEPYFEEDEEEVEDEAA